MPSILTRAIKIVRSRGIVSLFNKVFRIFYKKCLNSINRVKKFMQRKVKTHDISTIARSSRLSDAEISWIENSQKCTILLTTVSDTLLPKSVKCAIHVHVYYLDIADEILNLLSKDELFQSKIFFTVTSDSDKKILSNLVEQYCIKNYSVLVVENRGRDLRPLFSDLSHLWHEFDYLCHLHSKKSPHTNFGDSWRSYLIKNLIGTPSVVSSIIKFLQENEDVAIAYPKNYSAIQEFLLGMKNSKRIAKILKQLNLGSIEQIDFPAGSMCWIRTAHYREQIKILKTVLRYEEENGQRDNTTAHALERLLTLIPHKMGFKCVSYDPLIPETNHVSPSRNSYTDWMRGSPEIIEVADEKPLKRYSSPHHNENSLDIHWVIPNFVKGAGGHTTIFRFIKYFDDLGHRQTIWCQTPATSLDANQRLRDIQQWYQPIQRAKVERLPIDVSSIAGDVVIATDCWTSFPVVSMQFFKSRFYFIQDFEPSFHAVGSSYLTAEASYKLGLTALPAGNWLEGVAQSYGMETYKWNLGVDSQVFKPNPDFSERKQYLPFRIAFYARQNTSRRCSEMGISALNSLYERGYKFEVMIFGEPDFDADQIRFPFFNLGVCGENVLVEVYYACDVGMVFSSTNYSLIPLEMMAAGLPVLDLDVPSVNAEFPDEVLYKAEPTSRGIRVALEKLIETPSLLSAYRAAGLEFSAKSDWNAAFKTVENAIYDQLDRFGSKPVNFEKAAPEVHFKRLVTVAIPTFNAGSKFAEVIEKVTRQDLTDKYEVLIIDSGSSDETVETIKRFPSVRLHEIQNSEFQHGRTRNLCIELSDSQFTAFLTQDALPKNETWLKNLVAPFSKSDQIAGVFGRHEAYPHHDLFTQNLIKRHFDNQKSFGTEFNWGSNISPSVCHGSSEWRLLMAFYSDNNSAMRKSVWEQVPYPSIDWGEDQVWADEIVRLGLTKAYADDAIVYHSHSYEELDSKRVAKHEHDMFLEFFGHRFCKNKVELFQQIHRALLEADRAAKRLNIPNDVLETRKNGIIHEHIGRNYSMFVRDES